MSNQTEITDVARLDFLRLLAATIRDPKGLAVSEWEQHFLASWRQSSRPSLWFTPGRRSAVDRMWMKYGGEKEINLPHPSDRVNETAAQDKADPDGCEYYVRLEGLQRRCNDPAEFVNTRDFRYCRAHAEEVQQNGKRRGAAIVLRRYTPKQTEGAKS